MSAVRQPISPSSGRLDSLQASSRRRELVRLCLSMTLRAAGGAIQDVPRHRANARSKSDLSADDAPKADSIAGPARGRPGQPGSDRPQTSCPGPVANGALEPLFDRRWRSGLSTPISRGRRESSGRNALSRSRHRPTTSSASIGPLP